MICKQKKLVKVLLLTVVVSLFTMTTAFAQEYPTQNNNARYIGISMLNADLSIDDNFPRSHMRTYPEPSRA